MSLSTNNTTTNYLSNISLGDWSLIKGGSYKKLLKSYYKETTSPDSEAIATSVKQTQVLANKASALASATESLTSLIKSNSSFSSLTKDEQEKAMAQLYEGFSKYVNAYNETIQATDDVENTTALRSVLNMTRNTKANSGLLSKIGITVKEDNSLSIDEEKFMSAKQTDISSLFIGNSTYSSHMLYQSKKIKNVSNALVATSSKACSYTNSGTYANILSNVSSFNDEF